MKLLNLGCGKNYHKEWINIDFISSSKDVIQYNLLNGIPLESQSVDVIYHSHVLEHFSKNEGEYFISECYRVLKKNGILRVAVPDLETIAKEYLKNLNLALKGDVEGKNNYEWIKLELFDQMVRNESGGEMKKYLYQPFIINENYVFKRIGSEGRIIRESFFKNQKLIHNEFKRIPLKASVLKLVLKKMKRVFIKLGRRERARTSASTAQKAQALRIGQFRLGGEIHQWMYDRYSLSELLKEAGFKEIRICTPFESEIVNWESYQLDVIEGEVRKPDSLFIEAKII